MLTQEESLALRSLTVDFNYQLWLVFKWLIPFLIMGILLIIGIKLIDKLTNKD